MDADGVVVDEQVIAEEQGFGLSNSSYILLAIFAIRMSIKLYKIIRPNSFKKALKAGEFNDYELIAKNAVTKNTSIYRFKLGDENTVLGLPVGQHISIRATIDEKKVMRSYTPISLDSEAKGYFELLVKSYDNGTMSKYIGELEIGDKITVCGPQGGYNYTANCRKKLGMICGGTGITPMYQILKTIVENPEDKTEVSLIYGSECEQEIFLKNEIDAMALARPDQIKVYYLVDKTENPHWEGGIGYITDDIMNEKLAKPDEEGVQLLLCGPPRMVSFVKRTAVSMGYIKGKPLSKMEDQIFVF